MIGSVVAHNSKSMAKILARCPVLPVMTIPQLEDALPLARALRDGGLQVMEVTLRTSCALEAIDAIIQDLPDVCVGGGTVTSVNQLQQLSDICAGFAVSPGLTVDLLRHAKAIDMPYLPGIASVSELMVGINEGYDCFKFFPAVASGGVATLRSLVGPFANVKFCPTGGINQENFAEYLALPNIVSVGGSWLTPEHLIKAKDWDQITKISRDFVENLRSRP